MSKSSVILIKKEVRDGYGRAPLLFAAVASDRAAALRWIQEEVDGKHESDESRYAKGHDAEWWIDFGTFTLVEVEVFT